MTTSVAAYQPVQAVQQATPLVANPAPSSGGLSFSDVLDAVNPLQHIPIVSSLYRAATGSHISTGSQIAGDTLYGTLFPGGALAGFASSVANAAVKEISGKDIGELAVSAVSSSSQGVAATPLTPTSQTAAATPVTVAQIPPVPYASFNHAADVTSSRYQQVQALDAINRKLLKMTA